MKKVLLAFLAAITIAAPTYAQGIELGIGITAPLTGRSIVTTASIDDLGIVHATRTLDTAPQIVIEFHKTFKAGKLGIGPMIGFAPKIDFGTVSNLETEQPLGAGFGIAVQIPSPRKQKFNVGLLWLITSPVTQLSPDFVDGFQAPRTSISGPPLPLSFERHSVNRICLTLTVSGLF